MRAIVSTTKRFLTSEEGPTATEYAVMLALIIVVAITGITLLGNKVNLIFTNVDSQLNPGAGVNTPQT